MYTDAQYEDGQDDETPAQKKLADEYADGVLPVIVPRGGCGWVGGR
jgi:hypothetical protein